MACLPPPRLYAGGRSGFVDAPHFGAVQRDQRGARAAEQDSHPPARIGQGGEHATRADQRGPDITGS